MRATEYLFLVVIIGAFMGLVVLGTNELNNAFPQNQINNSYFAGYDYSSTITNQANKTFSNFQKLGDTETSWFSRIGAGIVAIPYAVISFPVMLAEAFWALSTMISKALGNFVPSFIILAIIGFMTIEGVRRLMEFFQRSRA